MQMTDMASRNDLAQTQKILNDQLLDQLVYHRTDDGAEGDKSENDHEKGDN